MQHYNSSSQAMNRTNHYTCTPPKTKSHHLAIGPNCPIRNQASIRLNSRTQAASSTVILSRLDITLYFLEKQYDFVF